MEGLRHGRVSSLRQAFQRPFQAPGFLVLWIVGGISNAMLWLEILAAAVFTLERTGSGWDVALVSAARALPLLGFGAIIGVVADAWDRRRIVGFGLLLTAGVSGTLGLLSAFDAAQPWHVGIAALFSGFVYATEMPARRRLIAECVGGSGLDGAVALDSLTSFATRCVGPLIGGLAYQAGGLAGAFFTSALCNLGAAVLVLRLEHRQATRPLDFRGAIADLRDGLAFVRTHPGLRRLLAVTIVMNLFGYSYATLIPLVARDAFGLTPVWTGALAAAEPAGAFCGGLLLVRAVLPGMRLTWMAAGAAILLAGLVMTAAVGSEPAPLSVVLAILAAGGVGSAIYTNNQTAIVVAETPPVLRSRAFGLVTVCIGSWPIGMLIAGGLAGLAPPLLALGILAICGLASLAALRLVAGASAGPTTVCEAVDLS